MATKTPMGEREFYDVRNRARIEVPAGTIDVREIPGSKYKDGHARFQLVGGTPDGRKVYKFVSRATAQKWMADHEEQDL